VVNDLEKLHIVLKHWATPGHNLGSAAWTLHGRLAEGQNVSRRFGRQLAQSGNDSIFNRLSDVLWLFARLIETGEMKKDEGPAQIPPISPVMEKRRETLKVVCHRSTPNPLAPVIGGIRNLRFTSGSFCVFSYPSVMEKPLRDRHPAA
jgi:hypothetical protein